MYQARAMYQATAIHTGYVSRARYIPIHPGYKSREWPSTGIHAIHSRYVLDTRRDTYPEGNALYLTTGLRWRLPTAAGGSSTTSLALALGFLASGCGAARLRLAAGLTAGAAGCSSSSLKCIQCMYRACIKVCIPTLECKYRPDTDVSLRIHLDTLDTRWIRAGYVSKARYMADTSWIRIEGKPSLFRGKTELLP